MELWMWAAAFISIALILYAIEIFVPSGGVIGLVATISLISGIVALFWVNTTLGIIGTIVVIVAAPFVMALAIKIFPSTPVGRLLTLNDAQKAGVVRYDAARDENPDQLVGATGTAVTELRPVGTCKINGQRLECLAEGGLILPGSSVKVISVDGMQIKVRPT
jgi:membrane-bound ClpP family serine protease